MDKTELGDKQEIIELTNLLKNEWNTIRDLITNKNINVDKSLLVTYMESEDCIEFGILITEKKEVLKFTIENNVISIEKETDIEKLRNDFSQVKVGLDMLKKIYP